MSDTETRSHFFAAFLCIAVLSVLVALQSLAIAKLATSLKMQSEAVSGLVEMVQSLEAQIANLTTSETGE